MNASRPFGQRPTTKRKRPTTMPVLPKPSESATEFTIVDKGVYTARFVTFDGPKVSRWDETKQAVEITFQITDDQEFEGVTIKKDYGWSMHPTAHLYKLVEALAGEGLDPDAEMELGDLLDRRVMITVGHNVKPRRDNPNETIIFNRIDAVGPARRQRSRPAGDERAKSPFTRPAESGRQDQGEDEAEADWASVS